jgi:beta-xylosidase
VTNTAYVAITSTGVEYAAVSTLADAFTESSLDSSLWSYVSSGSPASTASVAGSGLQISIAASSGLTIGGITSNAPVCLTDGSFAASLTATTPLETAGDKLGASVIFSVVQNDTTDSIGMQMAEGTLSGWYTLGGTESVVFSVAYNATTMAWLRVRESAGVVYFETSSDDSTWTTRGSVADPVNTSALYAQLNGYGWGSGVAGSATFNSVTGTGGGAASVTSPIVSVTAVAVAPDGSIVASPGSGLPDVITAAFSYGASNQDIRDAIQSAVRAAAADTALDVSFVTD